MVAFVALGTLTIFIDQSAAGASTVELTATPEDFVEGSIQTVTLDAVIQGAAGAHTWEQVSGPLVPLVDLGPNQAVVDVSALQVAVDVELVFELELTVGGNPESASIAILARAADFVSPLGPNVQIGGSSTAVARFAHDGVPWVLFNIGAKLIATVIGPTAGPKHSVQLDGFVRDILVVDHGKKRFALVSTGEQGIAVVDVTNPVAMTWKYSVGVNYHQDGLTWAEGGGDILTDQVVSGTRGTITSLATDGVTLWIANANYGLHRTALSNVLGAGTPVVEADGTLRIDAEQFTLQFAGEEPWGAPLRINFVGDRLFVALEFLGLGIYRPNTLQRVGRYNLYTDVTMTEDWFLGMDPAQAVQPGFLDADTGMPDFRQASYELVNSHGDGGGSEPIATPWADFDRYGKYYYNARDVAVARFDGRSIAYIAYGLGGLVAVDVTGFAQASAENPLEGRFIAYVPGVPAHGPDEFIGSHSEQILAHFGAGMLKEAGVVSVAIDGHRAIYTDHFAGLVVLKGAHRPGKYWRGNAAPYDNDNGIPGDHVPDYEFVTSFDMSPEDPTDHESLPAWMYEEPCSLVTGEVGGHGGDMILTKDPAFGESGMPDVLMCVGAGGFEFIDIVDLKAETMTNRYLVPAYFPTTDEIGAAPDGSPTQTISIGHAAGIAATNDYLYVADGPHGIIAWNLLDPNGVPADSIHVVANSVQDEYPVELGGTTIYPATHATAVVLDAANDHALTLCQSVGLRRVAVDSVENGSGIPGSPILIAPLATDIFEHNGEAGKIDSLSKQDHAYDVALDGSLAFVADGGNGLTIYDLSKDPTILTSGFFVSNLGGDTQQKPVLGRTTGVALWTDPQGGAQYAMMACGPKGVGVVDVSNPAAPSLVKVFEPIKLEDEKVGKADGRCVDVFIDGDHAWFSYDGFGVVCYALADLIAPLPLGTDPTDIWEVQGDTVVFDHRPVAVGEYRLRDDPDYADWGGGALQLAYTSIQLERKLYIAYGVAGIVKLDWSTPSTPILEAVEPTVGECTAIAHSNGRLFAADGAGGFVYFK